MSGDRANPVIRVTGLAHVLFQVPDLDAARDFMLDFGLRVARQDADALYMTGGTESYLYKAVPGEPRFLGLGLTAASDEDLDILAAATDTVASEADRPGGGRHLSLRDPNGFTVEVVAGRERADPGHARSESWNNRHRRERVGVAKRLDFGPAEIVGLGHCVLGVRSFATSGAWYRRLFGFLVSDEVHKEPGTAMGAFMRCDLGSEPADHHTLFLAEVPGEPAFRHAAFEVRDMDALMAGHSYLKARGREPFWGIGRHYLGSQVFDYWRDPWNYMFEHMTDGDVFTEADAPNIASMKELHAVQWGPSMPVA